MLVEDLGLHDNVREREETGGGSWGLGQSTR